MFATECILTFSATVYETSLIPRRIRKGGERHCLHVPATAPCREFLTLTSISACSAISLHLQGHGYRLSRLPTARYPSWGPVSPICRPILGPPQGRIDLHNRRLRCRKKSLRRPSEAGVHHSLRHRRHFSTTTRSGRPVWLPDHFAVCRWAPKPHDNWQLTKHLAIQVRNAREAVYLGTRYTLIASTQPAAATERKDVIKL
jgi:hypothetical protein